MTRLTATAEEIARTEHLPAPLSSDDEVGRLGRAFTAMLAALQESRRRQRDLVADAAHELRTPLTSLRTNVDLLALERTVLNLLDNAVKFSPGGRRRCPRPRRASPRRIGLTGKLRCRRTTN
nr:histidine kinase dimerization/phospho-acceptor domain-containing protein [Amycolatopsis kentuckyensis]